MSAPKKERIRLSRLEITNYQTIKIIKFDILPGVNDISGRCAQGKSTIPQAVVELLRKGGVSSRPLRTGADKGEIRGLFSDGSTITKKLKPDGAEPSRRVSDGMKGGLETWHGWITDQIFDPLAFKRLGDTKPGRRLQAEMIAALAHCDTTPIDDKRKAAVEARTAIGRTGEALKAQLDAIVVPEAIIVLRDGTEIPDERPIVDAVDVADIASRKADAATQKAGNDKAREGARRASAEAKSADEAVGVLERQIEDLQRHLAAAVDRSRKAVVTLKDAEANAAALIDPDTADIDRQIADARTANTAARADAEAHNRRVRAAREQAAGAVRDREERDRLIAAATKQRDGLAAKVAAERVRWEAENATVKTLDEERAALIAAAKMPIDGMTIAGEGTDREIYYRGEPFSQSSGAEGLLVGCAIGFAQNPALGLLSIDYGDALDRDLLAVLQAQLVEHDADAFVIHVVDPPADGQPDQRKGLVIEGGEIVADNRPELEL